MAKTKDKNKPDKLKFLTESMVRGTAQFADFRTETFAQRKVREGMTPHSLSKATVQLRKTMEEGGPDSRSQRKSNQTGLPDQLKSGIENLSGFSMDDVRVHFNSSKPAQLQAHAYAQGSEIHVAPGQEKHLPHEAWHVVQQKQGRVKPTRQLKSSVNINDDTGLEKEADVMGAKALSGGIVQRKELAQKGTEGKTVQMERYADLVDLYSGGQIGQKVLVIEVNMAGSGNEFPANRDAGPEWIRMVKDKRIAHSFKLNESGANHTRLQVNFEGPGGPHTTGPKSKAMGAMDGGSNGTENLTDLVPIYIDRWVNSMQREGPWVKTVVIISAHSRGAVAAYDVAHRLKKDHDDWHIELSQFDPVPGPNQSNEKKAGMNRRKDMPVGPRAVPLDEHTVVYSVASGWFTLFSPMKLFSMKRLIITQRDHSAGVGEDFYYKGKAYNRRELNGLPRGIYVQNPTQDNLDRIQLIKAPNTDVAKQLYKEIKRLARNKSDSGREDTILQAIDQFETFPDAVATGYDPQEVDRILGQFGNRRN